MGGADPQGHGRMAARLVGSNQDSTKGASAEVCFHDSGVHMFQPLDDPTGSGVASAAASRAQFCQNSRDEASEEKLTDKRASNSNSPSFGRRRELDKDQ
mgnify:FL=1